MEQEKLVSLVKGAQSGDAASFEELFEAFYNDVYYFALKTVKEENLACDITQEAFIEIFNTIQNLKEPAAFAAWMRRITYHQCTRYFKKKKDVLMVEDEDGNTMFDSLADDDASAIPSEMLEKEDFRKTILSMIDTLSEEQRSAIFLYYFDELSVAQIAEIQGVSEGTVKSRLNYARKAMKKSVEEYEEKTGTKLYGISVLGLFRFAFSDKKPLSKAAAEKIRKAALPKKAAAPASAAQAAKSASAAGRGALRQLPGIVKGFAAVAAAVLVGTGIYAGISAARNHQTPDMPAQEESSDKAEQNAPAVSNTEAPTENEAVGAPTIEELSAQQLFETIAEYSAVSPFHDSQTVSSDLNGDASELTPMQALYYAVRLEWLLSERTTSVFTFENGTDEPLVYSEEEYYALTEVDWQTLNEKYKDGQCYMETSGSIPAAEIDRVTMRWFGRTYDYKTADLGALYTYNSGTNSIDYAEKKVYGGAKGGGPYFTLSGINIDSETMTVSGTCGIMTPGDDETIEAYGTVTLHYTKGENGQYYYTAWQSSLS